MKPKLFCMEVKWLIAHNVHVRALLCESLVLVLIIMCSGYMFTAAEIAQVAWLISITLAEQHGQSGQL